MAGAMTVQQAAHELVDRARLGDQNATAMLIQIRKNAEKGVPRAKESFGHAMAYTRGKSAPPSTGKSSTVGAESSLRKMKRAAPRVQSADHYLMLVKASPFAPSIPAAELLSRGPAIGTDVLSLVGSTFGSDDEKKAFEYGVIGPSKGVQVALVKAKPQFRRALVTGHVVGMARRIQAARAGNIAAISPKAHWELS